MARVWKSLLCSLGAVVVLAALWGCNGTDLDDPEFSDSLLIIDSVDPPALQSDVTSNSDPNSMLVSPPPDDSLVVKVRNLNRGQSESGIFGDIQIDSFDIVCDDPTLGGLINSSGNPSSLTVPASSSASITVSLFSGAFKLANSGVLLGISSSCAITFNGQDLSGEPILSQEAIFTYSFVDTP